MSPSKPRILLLATDCNPQWHSLPALAAEYYLNLYRYAEITLVTQVRNKSALKDFLPKNAKVVYLNTEFIAKPFYWLSELLTGGPNKGMTSKVAFRYPAYLYFEYRAYKQFKKSIANGKFDIIHRISPMSPTIPSLIPYFSKIPFVIGPLLGGLEWPKVFHDEMRREGEWLNYLRGLHRFLPFYSSTYGKATAILAGYQHTINDLPRVCHPQIIEFSEGGIYPNDFPERKLDKKKRDQNTPNNSLSILFVGRMVPFKQPEILIQCFAKSVILQQHKLIMIGDGPELPRLKAMVKEKQLEKNVVFTGAIALNDVKEWMYKADIFGFPSIREQGGGVITMASMSGMPSVVVDYGGPITRVPEDCGIRVPLERVGSLTLKFQQALELMVSQPKLLEKKGKAAREYTKRFYDWDWKAKKTLEIYQWVLGERKIKPNSWRDSNDNPKNIGPLQ